MLGICHRPLPFFWMSNDNVTRYIQAYSGISWQAIAVAARNRARGGQITVHSVGSWIADPRFESSTNFLDKLNNSRQLALSYNLS
jgi:hypothetical protein